MEHKALTADLRALSHEELAQQAAFMAVTLAAIALGDTAGQAPAELAGICLLGTCVEAIQSLVLL